MAIEAMYDGSPASVNANPAIVMRIENPSFDPISDVSKPSSCKSGATPEHPVHDKKREGREQMLERMPADDLSRDRKHRRIEMLGQFGGDVEGERQQKNQVSTMSGINDSDLFCLILISCRIALKGAYLLSCILVPLQALHE